MEKKENSMSSSTGAIKKKRDEKHRKRDPRSWDNIKKSVTTMTAEEKMSYISEKYSELYDEHRTLTSSVNNLQKAFADIMKEKDREQAELTKAILAKGHLESLCRELQKQNKAIREENLIRIKEEEERRREIANNFSESLNALTTLMTESKDKSNKVKEENENMSDRLTELCSQFQAREDHLDALQRQLELQKQLYETTIKKNDITHKAEKETLLQEKALLQANLEKSELKVKVLSEKVESLEAHVAVYKSQYAEFESTMAKSNKVFNSFKDEMGKMSKQVTLLEKERDEWKNRWQSSAGSLISVSEQHASLTYEFQKSEKRLRALQKLCRRIQAERMTYMQQLKKLGIELEQPTVVIDEDEERAVDEPSQQKPPESLVELKRDLQKIQGETSGAAKQQSAAEQEKLTAKEELLKVLKDELADLQKEVGLPSRDPPIPPSPIESKRQALLMKKGKSFKRATKKKLVCLDSDDEGFNGRHLLSTENLPPILPAFQLFSVNTSGSKSNQAKKGNNDSPGPSTSTSVCQPSTSTSVTVQLDETEANEPHESIGLVNIQNGNPSTSSAQGSSQPPSGAPHGAKRALREPEESSSTATTSDTDEGIELPKTHLNGILGIEAYETIPEEQRQNELPHIIFPGPFGMGMGDGQRVPDPMSDDYVENTSSDDSFRMSDLRSSLPEDSSSNSVASIQVQTEYSNSEDIPILDIMVENMIYTPEISSASSSLEAPDSMISLSPRSSGSARSNAQVQTLFSVPVLNIMSSDSNIPERDGNADIEMETDDQLVPDHLKTDQNDEES